jgi:hypothetical protein
MPHDPKTMTVQDLLDAPIDTLSNDDMARRSAIVNLMKSERELEVVNEQNRRYQEEKDARQKRSLINLENIKREQEENERVQKICKHMTGGKDRPGFFNGDGDIYGYAVSKQMLPTGEIYGLCFRCQKEWHHPRWTGGMRQVMAGKMTLTAYFKQEREYQEMLGWTCKTFEGNAGELPGGAMFLIPRLIQQQREDMAAFTAYLEKIPPNQLVLAGYVPAN